MAAIAIIEIKKMGYRSDVALVVTRDLFSEMMKKIPKQTLDLVKYSKRFESLDDAMLLYFESIKWYTDTNPIKDVMRFVESEENEESYYIVEIGEELSHNEERGGYWDNPFEVSMVRSIFINSGGKQMNYKAFE